MSDHSLRPRLWWTGRRPRCFAAIGDVRSWWSGEIDGETDRLGAEFRYRYGDLHDSTQRITEWGSRAAGSSGTSPTPICPLWTKPGEWKGTDIVFDLADSGGGTEVRFTHVSLAPQWECYDACSNAWSVFSNGNLRAYITPGRPTW